MANPWPIPAGQSLTTGQIAKLRSCPDFQYVFSFITKSWGPDNAGRPISISIDDHVNTVWWVWTHWDPFQASFHKDYAGFDDYIAKSCGASAPTADQIGVLKCCPDFQNVINTYVAGGWNANNVAGIATNWARSSQFVKEYGTISNYLAKRCAGVSSNCQSTPTATGSLTSPSTAGTALPDLTDGKSVLSWLQANPVAAAVIGFLLYTILFRRR